MTDKRMALVPRAATNEIQHAQLAVAISISPNAGKVSREQVRECCNIFEELVEQDVDLFGAMASAPDIALGLEIENE